MSTFKEIRGQLIRKYTTNPTNPLEGQMWYNSTTGTLKGAVQLAAAWSSATVYPTARRDAAGFGTQTAGVVFGGSTPRTAEANEWNGSSWTGATAVPTAINGLDATGPQTAGLTAGGNTPGSPVTSNTASFDYNGASWSANPTLPVGRTGNATIGGAAAQTAAIAISGEPSGMTSTSAWDGSSWTVGATVPTWAQGTSGGGTPAAAFCQGNVNDATATLDFDGSSWTAGNSASNGHNYGGAGGLATDGITFGGTQVPNPGVKTVQAELYDGTNWSTGANMGTGRSSVHGKCTVTAPACLCATGNVPPSGFSNLTEEFNAAYVATQTLTTS